MFFEVYNSRFLFTLVDEVMKMREEEKKQSSRKLGIKRFFKKRWVYPAIYIGAAAILLTTFLWFQAGEDGTEQKEFGYDTNPNSEIARDDALEVGKPVEEFAWPVADENEVKIVTHFYDAKASDEEQEAAIINDGNNFYPSTGIAIAAEDGEAFDVLAAMSGTVTSIQEDTVLGNVVTIEHAEGIETIYQALADVKVTEGEKVKQGDVLGKAGRSLLNEDAGIHTHFEIRKDGTPVNPLEYFNKSLTTLQEEADTEESNVDEEAEEDTEDSTRDEEDASEEESSDEENEDAKQNE